MRCFPMTVCSTIRLGTANMPNFTGHHAMICYSFLCLVDKVGQFMQTGWSDRTLMSQAMLMAKPAMQELEGDDKSYNGPLYYLPCVLDTVQWQQQVKGCVPHHGMESKVTYTCGSLCTAICCQSAWTNFITARTIRFVISPLAIGR